MVTMYKCYDCDKTFPTKKGRAGHMWLSHRTRPGWKFEIQSKVASLEEELVQCKSSYQALLQQNQKRVQVATFEQSESEVRVQELESQLKYPFYSNDLLKDGKYCPKCGKLISRHRVINDLLLGKRMECPE